MTNSGHSQDVGTSVLKELIQPDRLVELLNDALNRLYPHETRMQSTDDRGQSNPRTRKLRGTQVRFNAFRASIAKFGAFLTNLNITEVAVDEKLMQDFERYLSETGTPSSYLRNHRNQTRKLINALPSDILQRELVTMAAYKHAHRWDNYSDETPTVLADFEKNGRKLKSRCSGKSAVVSSTLLSEPYREQIVRETMTFLRVIQATDILKVTVDDVEEFIEYYQSKGKKQTALGILDYIHPLFWNLLAKGRISCDPLADLPRKERCENLDYVDQHGIDLLGDLNSVDMNNFMDVRDRLIAFSMDYDFALRTRECSLVEEPDLRLAEHTLINLRKEIQKVRRADVLLFSYFPEVTRPLIDRYLELRKRRHPRTNMLVISDSGVPLNPAGCREAVKAQCVKLGVKTVAGHTPTPHRLRHSFGTLNINPLGRCLDITVIKRHYRHSSIETTEKLYLSKNPILAVQSYEADMRRINGDGQPTRRTTPYNVVSQIQPPDHATGFGISIPEDKAVRMVRPLGLNYKSLRAYGLKVGKARQSGRGCEYSAEFVADLAKNYLTTQEAIALLKMPRSSFFAWRHTEGVECIQIGQVGLYRRDCIIEKRRAG